MLQRKYTLHTTTDKRNMKTDITEHWRKKYQDVSPLWHFTCNPACKTFRSYPGRFAPKGTFQPKRKR